MLKLKKQATLEMTYFLNNRNVKQHCTCNIVLTTYTILLYLLHYAALNCSNTGDFGFLLTDTFRITNHSYNLWYYIILQEGRYYSIRATYCSFSRYFNKHHKNWFNCDAVNKKIMYRRTYSTINDGFTIIAYTATFCIRRTELKVKRISSSVGQTNFDQSERINCFSNSRNENEKQFVKRIVLIFV